MEGCRGPALSTPPRLLPGCPLPAHPPYVPGRGVRPPALDAAAQSTQDAIALGVDLFHAGYFWEAHEAWERAWHKVAPGSAEEAVARALIRTTAAHVKRRLGNARGVELHRRGAQGHLASVPSVVELGSLRIDTASLRTALSQDELPRTLPVERR